MQGLGDSSVGAEGREWCQVGLLQVKKWGVREDGLGGVSVW